ncbi:MAG: repeat-containing protein [Candidatus Taylorbacteria bacterium]|nr:repeat-containing protein [Candidatus Taylorbacteria bacterium]
MKDFLKKIVSKINLNSKRTKIILVIAIVLVALFFIGRYFYNQNHISDYSQITILVNNREYVLAEQKLQALLSNDSSDPYFLILVARTYIGRSGQVGDATIKKDYLNKAIQVLNTAEGINDGIGQMYSIKGLAYLYLGEYDFALTYYKKALSLEPDSSNFLVDLGNLYLTTNDIAGGFDTFSKILKIDPNNENAQIGLIRLYMLQQKYDQAINSSYVLFTTTTNESIKSELAEIMGSAYLRVNKYVEAKKFFSYILNGNPNSAFANYGLAEVSFDSSFDLKHIASSTEESRQLALKSVSLDATYPYNYVLLARIALITKNKADYDKYVNLAKTSLASYAFILQNQKDNLLKTIPAFGVVNKNVTIKQTSVTSTTTRPQGSIILRKK